MKLSPITQRRLAIFCQNRRGYWSFWLFMVLFGFSLFAEFIANDRPLLIRFDGHWYVPVLQGYSEDTFGADFLPTEADYTDPDVQKAINAKGWMIRPAVPYSYNTIVKDLPSPAPSPPSRQNLLGTDDQARDVLARVIYGFRLSVLFGFALRPSCHQQWGSRPARCRVATAARPTCCSSALHRDLERHAATGGIC